MIWITNVWRRRPILSYTMIYISAPNHWKMEKDQSVFNLKGEWLFESLRISLTEFLILQGNWPMWNFPVTYAALFFDWSIDIQDCASNPCNNDATCVEVAEGYKCVCQPGFTGTNCEVEEDECVASPCAKGATCVDKVKWDKRVYLCSLNTLNTKSNIIKGYRFLSSSLVGKSLY